MTAGLSGGKETSWNFRYNETEGKQNKIIVFGKGKQCGHKIAGNNPTNLKRHIKAHNKDSEVG